MLRWIAIGIIIVTALMILVYLRPTIDDMRGGALIQLEASHVSGEGFADMEETQHRLLGLEGERRYNDFARVQNPETRLSPDSVNAALRNLVATPSSNTASMMTMLESTLLGAADDGAGKSGSVEDTGVVQQKINFCESMPLNCDTFSDPRFAECGFCHRDGVSSKGDPHRGGMFISAEDQARANEVSRASGLPAVYAPTIGTCKPADFTLVSGRCLMRENQLECQRAGAATSANKCGQCFGITTGKETGLLYVGPKPKQFKANLHVSGGASISINRAAAVTVGAPTKIPMNITEGDSFTVTINGVPEFWCGWIASEDGLRTVSVDIAEQSVSEPNKFSIVGDKRTSRIATFMKKLPADWSATVPTSVLWYGRHNMEGAGTITLNCVMPATLTNPLYTVDTEICPTGPLVLTERGAGIMGANSCFKPDGTFSAGLVCIQRMFRAAGGTDKGTLYPRTAEAALALARKASGSTLSLDKTMDYFNERANIAIYRVNNSNAPQDLEIVKVAALEMLGITITNPCDGPNAEGGPHSAECLDYLWRTSGNSSQDTVKGGHSKLPYAYCGKDGAGAPINANGVVNQANTNAANAKGSIPAIRAFYNGLFNRTYDAKFDVQAAAMRDCYGSNIRPPPQNPSECPAPNPTEFQCFGPSKLARPEVYWFDPNNSYSVTRGEAAAVCARFNARVATMEELADAQRQGADWCATGWVQDSEEAKYPITTSTMGGCGNGRAGVITWTPEYKTAGINCYGLKPPPGTPGVRAFNASRWNTPNVLPPGYSHEEVRVLRAAHGGLQWLTQGNGIASWRIFKSEAACEAALPAIRADPHPPVHGGVAGSNPTLAPVEKYFRERV